MDKHAFSFGHYDVVFPQKSLDYYPWLNELFGYGTIGETKQKLTINLIDYMKEIPQHVIRNLQIELKHLELFYNKGIYNTTNKENMILLESFLSNGPGATKGLDMPYRCIHCNISTMTPDPPRPFISHNIIEYTSKNGPSHMICSHCGINWYVGVHNTPKKCIINEHQCIHEWQ